MGAYLKTALKERKQKLPRVPYSSATWTNREPGINFRVQKQKRL